MTKLKTSELTGATPVGEINPHMPGGVNMYHLDTPNRTKLYAAPQTFPEWTPCRKWLPAVGERYLCSGHGGKQFICWFDGASWRREPQGKKVFGITHWMNLPDYPEDNE